MVYLASWVMALLLSISRIAQTEGLKTAVPIGDHLDSIVHQGIKRYFLIHIPENFKNGQQVALVFVLHGGGGTPRAIADLTGFSKLADAEGFIVVYPAAVNRHWNDGRGVGRFKSHRESVDDVGFIAQLIDTLSRRLAVDPSRIYATGISNGGMMCQRLGLELSDRLAAVASVAASLPETRAVDFNPQAPISVLMINGTEDRVVPYDGGGVGLFSKRGGVIGVEKAIELWVNYNKCLKTPVMTVIRSEQDTVYRVFYSGGRDNTVVVLYKISGAGHIWPGGKRRPARFGKHITIINATRIIWEFFITYPRR